jgi:Myb-like DNA-binding domain
MREMTTAYSGSTKFHLRSLDLDNPDIPKHILGFHFDFKLTKQRIDQYYDEKYQRIGNCEWDKWEAFNDLEKEAYLQTIRMLKFQQSWLKEEEESERMRATGATKVKRPNNRLTMNRSVIGVSRNKKRMVTGTGTNTMNTKSGVSQSKKIKSSSRFELWTPVEDEKLIEAVQAHEHGNGISWRLISISVFQGNRSENGCRNRWRKLQTASKGDTKYQVKQEEQLSDSEWDI